MSCSSPASGRRRLEPRTWQFNGYGYYSEQGGECVSKPAYRPHALERARILRRLRLSLRDLFFFHFSLMLDNDALAKIAGKREYTTYLTWVGLREHVETRATSG
jgi:hypothetical protein